MATGKTNSKHYRLYVDEIDLSGNARSVGSFGNTYTEDDATGWSEGIINYTLGHLQTSLPGYQGVFHTAQHTELAAREEYLVSLLIGIKAAPAAGDPAYLAPLEQKSYNVDGNGPVMVSADFVGPGSGTYTLPSNTMGFVLMPYTNLTATTNGTAVNLGSAFANGALAHLHVISSDSGDFAFKIEDSATGAFSGEETDLITFTADGSAAASEQGVVSGEVLQYVRFVATRTSGSCYVVCTFARQ